MCKEKKSLSIFKCCLSNSILDVYFHQLSRVPSIVENSKSRTLVKLFTHTNWWTFNESKSLISRDIPLFRYFLSQTDKFHFLQEFFYQKQICGRKLCTFSPVSNFLGFCFGLYGLCVVDATK